MSTKRQSQVMAWAVENFGPVARNRDERAARLVEEAIEVAHATGLDPGLITKIMDRVYSRPVGSIGQEIGGTMITLEALADNLGIDADYEATKEFNRVSLLPKEWWQKKHAEKATAGTADLSPPKSC